ncbi:2-dehydropantoate 2-reductase [Bacillus timonensis]|nr:2-dehydropantoate 2-reductase [Bacillus timonensis]
MKIGVIGGGALGLLYSSYLSTDHQVTVFTRTISQANSLNKEGITLQRGEELSRHYVIAEVFNPQIHTQDLFIFTVKQYNLQKILEQIYKLPQTPTLLFLQNGMGHLPLLSNLKNENIILGVVEHGALKISDTHVIHSGVGTTKISPWRGNEETVSSVFNEVQNSSFSYEIKRNWYEMLSNKLIINTVINPLTAIYKVRNGELIENKYLEKSMFQVFTEAMLVLQGLDSFQTWNQILSVCRKTSSNRSSMLRDIEENRQTEIDAILGFIIHEADKKRIDIPVIRFLYHSIKGMEYKGG